MTRRWYRWATRIFGSLAVLETAAVFFLFAWSGSGSPVGLRDAVRSGVVETLLAAALMLYIAAILLRSDGESPRHQQGLIHPHGMERPNRRL